MTGPTSSGTLPTLNSLGGIGASAGAGKIGSDPSQINIDASNQPPQMKTLIYSPDVRVLIAHGTKTYDVSGDILRCSIHRAESSAASFFMTLSNKGLRYTPKNGRPTFSRMDRIVVYMKRTSFTQVFSGYLDTIPYKQLFPGTVDFKATCTIKRLMHTWWNPAIPQAGNLLQQNFGAVAPGPGQPGANPGMGNDNGLGDMLRRILTMVGGWNVADIHIQNFPTAFFDFMQSQVTKNQSVNDKAVENFKHLLLGDDISAGPGAAASHNSSAGTPGAYGPTGAAGAASSVTSASAVFYIQEIIAACDARGLGPLVSDNTQAAALNQVGTTAEGSRDQATSKAAQQLQQSALDAQKANRDSDAAIIAVAVSSVETGGSATLHNWANPAVPGSNAFGEGYPPYPCDLDSCGLFQQRSQGWGTVSQRMNPRQSAGMFFDALKSTVPDWRNMDPGAAAQQVQRSANSQGKYSAAVTSFAKAAVQSARSSTSGVGSSVISTAVAAGTTLPGPTNAPSGAGAAPSTNPNLTAPASGVTAAAVGIAGAADPLAAAKPHPDSEGAVNFMLSKVGNTPYVWGGKGPAGYDCSGLVSAAFASIGVAVPSQTDAIRAAITQIPKAQAGRGDIYEPESGHVTVLLGPPGTTLVQASTNNAPLSQQINVHTWYSEGGEWYGRACSNGGPDPTSPYNALPVIGSGTAPSALDQQAGAAGGSGTGSGGSGSDGSSELIARNLFSYMFTGVFAGDIGSYLPSEKQFINGQPLLQMVSAVCDASLRKFQSGPDGSFMAYYPDWWGLDGKPAVYQLEDIELKDVKINFTDDALTTHVYIEGDYQGGFGDPSDPAGWMDTAGVATVEDTWLYERLIKVAPGDPENASGELLMRRYGIRPFKATYAMAGSHELELLLACQVFMQKWAEQFQTQISVTFMPELYPGMRLLLVNHNLTVYVTEVVHVCDFEQGFSTSVTIMAPANPNAKALMAGVGGSADTIANSDASRGFTDPFNNGTGGVEIPVGQVPGVGSSVAGF